MPSINTRNFKVAADAQPLVDTALSRTDATGRREVVKLLKEAAAQNKDRYLTSAEARAVVDAFERTAGAQGTLAGPVLGEALKAARASIATMGNASNVDGVGVHFTFEQRISARMVAELNDAVARAAGRPMDVNMMIFEFQSDEIEKAIVDTARAHPNVTFRIVADSGQAADVGGNALPSILRQKLPNVEVKFKKDFPYAWDATKKMPRFNHGSTSGLNHHKGFATFIDGKPDRLLTGSFNWSNTADKSNYEDLVTFHNRDSATRRAIEQYGDEFAAFFNNNAACLSPHAFSNFKKEKWNEMVAANGERPMPYRPLPDDSYATYVLPTDTRGFDVNGFRAVDTERLRALVGPAVADAMERNRTKLGRFDSLEELKQRVPEAAALAPDVLAALDANATWGSAVVSINTATEEELDRVGLTRDQARTVIAHRETHGDFESVDELAKLPGFGGDNWRAARKHLGVVDVEAFFNSRPFGSPAGGTGYGSGGTRTTPIMGAGGAATVVPAGVTAGVQDLCARAPVGGRVDVAMYGMSATAPEFRALVDAARRGVSVRVVLNDAFTASTVTALKNLKAQGLPVDVRVQTVKTMHEKFGVVGDDVFFGSANFSESSSTKHSEDRFVVKNDKDTAAAFQARFDTMWEKSRIM